MKFRMASIINYKISRKTNDRMQAIALITILSLFANYEAERKQPPSPSYPENTQGIYSRQASHTSMDSIRFSQNSTFLPQK